MSKFVCWIVFLLFEVVKFNCKPVKFGFKLKEWQGLEDLLLFGTADLIDYTDALGFKKLLETSLVDYIESEDVRTSEIYSINEITGQVIKASYIRKSEEVHYELMGDVNNFNLFLQTMLFANRLSRFVRPKFYKTPILITKKLKIAKLGEMFRMKFETAYTEYDAYNPIVEFLVTRRSDEYSSEDSGV